MGASRNVRERRRHQDLIHPAGMPSVAAGVSTAACGLSKGTSHVSIATPPVSDTDGAGAGEADREGAYLVSHPVGIQSSPQGDVFRVRSAASAVWRRGHTMRRYVMDVAFTWYRRGYLQIPFMFRLLRQFR
jgi:hypothetical protein